MTQLLLDMSAELPRRDVQAVHFDLSDLNGTRRTLDSYRGRVLVLNFWATWCVPCVTEMPSMDRLYRQLQDQGLAMVGIDLREDRAQVEDFVKNKVRVSYDILLDETGAVSRTYGATTLPTTYIIGRSGHIVARIVGAREWDRPEVVAALTALLEQHEHPPQADSDTAPASGRTSIEMIHVHGLGYSPDGTQILVPAHDGLRVYAGGEWSDPELPRHDYMGFAAAASGFYSSGHPAPGSGLVNPLGLVLSTDGGRSFTTLAAAGESDFHTMAVGYHSGALYVLSEEPTPTMGAGVNYSVDQGKTWRRSLLNGLVGRVLQIAAHPHATGTVAVATERGLFLSIDHGNSFAALWSETPVTAAAFSPSGEYLLFGYQQLQSVALADRGVQDVVSPNVVAGDDVLTYLAFNPAVARELVAATARRDIFLGKHIALRAGTAADEPHWEQIARQGVGR